MKKLILIGTMFFAFNAHAGVLLEPYLGYATGSYSGDAEGKESGVGFGARIGYAMPMFWFALDGNQIKTKAKPDSGADFDGTITNIGATFGAELPGIRLMAGYVFSAENKDDDGSKLKGNGFKVGAGFKLPVLPIAFNLEYMMNKYDKFDSTAIDVKENLLFLSVSAPLFL